MTHGLSPVADSWYSPDDPARPDVEPVIPQYPFDQTRALALLAGEGWIRGADGSLVRQADGERFASEMIVRPGAGPVRQGQIIADNWKAIGAQVELDVLTPATLTDGQKLATRPGPSMITASGYNFYDRKLHSMSIPRAETRWSGNNRGGYSNPRVDTILDRLAATIDARERTTLHRALVQEAMPDIPMMPLFWEVVPILMLKGVSGPQMAGGAATANIREWDKAE
jgi:peptide/nickel transport system substrate-binding protein